ncbi:MAG: 3-phosphoshikimate 1-carboxyvinyltransferase [Planctomycetota bacterium]
MTKFIEVQPVPGEIDSSIRPPGSKSLTNRALLIAALANGTTQLEGVLESDDTRYMRDALIQLGIDVQFESDAALAHVVGCDGDVPNQTAYLFIGNSGTTIRFLTAMLGIAGGNYRLDGVPRMRERPIGPLVDALQQLGANVTAESPNDCPPVSIRSTGIRQSSVTLSGNLSSQYLSGLLMAAPLANHNLTIEIIGDLISRPYVEMTCEVMRHFGVQVERQPGGQRFDISAAQQYQSQNYLIEPDASAASYFWGAAAILGGRGTVVGLNESALQGDVGFVRCLEKMGAKLEFEDDSISVVGRATHGATLDMGDVSDTVQTLAAVALFVNGSTTIENIAHNRVKETDRIGNLAIELRKLGAEVDERHDGLTIHPGPGRPALIETYDDHRMAMSLALAGLKIPGVRISDPGCVSKTYPNYFDDLNRFVGMG